jgi:hypothetical protein
MDLLEDLGFALDLEECDISEEGTAADPESTDVLAAARRFQSGRSAAQQAYGDGKWRVGAGPMRLDWRCCVENMLSTTSLAEREECVRALGTLAQVCRRHGAWCVVRGAWCVVRGAWCVVRGAWCVVRGACRCRCRCCVARAWRIMRCMARAWRVLVARAGGFARRCHARGGRGGRRHVAPQ